MNTNGELVQAVWQQTAPSPRRGEGARMSKLQGNDLIRHDVRMRWRLRGDDKNGFVGAPDHAMSPVGQTES